VDVSFGVAGTRMHGEHHAPAGKARGAVVLVHGFNANLEEFGTLPEMLAAAGLHALAFDQRGFGRSQGERGRTSAVMAVEDIRAATAWLEGIAGPVPFGIVGHSLGGAYACAALGEMPVFRAAVLAHPVDTLFGELNPVERLAYHVLGRNAERKVRKGKPAGGIPYKVHYSEIFVSHEAAQAAKRDDILQKEANLGNYRDALAIHGAAWARQVRVPTLCVWSRHDRAVKPPHSQAVFANLAGPKEEFTHEGGHSCFRDLDGAKVQAAIATFLVRQFGGPK